MVQARASVAGQAFVTEYTMGAEGFTAESDYFDEYLSVLGVILKKEAGFGTGRSGDCGCSDVNECATNNHNCPSNANCIDANPGFACECKPGFKLFTANPFVCEDINECSTGTHDCSVNADCFNNIGSFTCQCKNGFTDIEQPAAGRNCVDFNECTNSNQCHL